MTVRTTTHTNNPKNYWVYLLCIVISFLFYGNTLKNGFSMDDELVTTTHRQSHPNVEKGISGIKDIFSSRYAEDGKQSYAFRPVTTYSFAIEYSLFKNATNRAQISHFISVLLYAISGIVLFILLQLLFKNTNWWFSSLVVFLFLIHPIHSEVVNNIKSRDELLAFIFGILLLINAVKYVDSTKWKYIVFSLIFLFLAVFSKETGAIFIVMIPVSLYFFRDIDIKKLIISYFLLFLTYFLIKKGFKFIVNKEEVRHFYYFENPLYKLDFIYRIPMFFYTILLYLILLFLPYPLKYYYGYNEITLKEFGDWEVYLGFSIVLFLLYFMLKGIKTKSIYSFIILFFFLSIGGAGNLLFPLPGIIAERFAFVASTGFIMGIVWLIYYLHKTPLNERIDYKKGKFFWIAVALISISSFGFTINRNKDWKTSLSLYETDMPKLHNSMKANSLLATEYATEATKIQQSGNLDNYPKMIALADSALKYYERALQLYKGANTLNNVGYIYLNLKNNTLKGIPYWRLAVEIEDDYQEGWYNLGSAYGKVKRHYDEIGVILGYSPSLEFNPTTEKIILDLRKLEQDSIVIMGLEAWETLNHLENVFKRIWSSNVDPRMANSFGNYASNVIAYQNGLLAQTNAGSYLVQLVKLPQEKQYASINQTLLKVRENLALKIKRALESPNYSPEELIRTGSYLYRDSFYTTFDQLHLVDSGYALQYNTISQFASIDDNPKKLIEWGMRFTKAFPTDASQGYMQIGSAYKRQENSDSSIYYFNKALEAIQKEIELAKNNNQSSKIKQLNDNTIRIKELIQNDSFQIEE